MTKSSKKYPNLNKYYSIESQWTYYGSEYRFYSLYNGARGAWTSCIEKAKDLGELHAKIILSLL